MKKTYQKPKTTIIVMQLQQMIALSRGGNATRDGEVLSRRHFIWDDFEDEYDYDFDFE